MVQGPTNKTPKHCCYIVQNVFWKSTKKKYIVTLREKEADRGIYRERNKIFDEQSYFWTSTLEKWILLVKTGLKTVYFAHHNHSPACQT